MTFALMSSSLILLLITCPFSIPLRILFNKNARKTIESGEHFLDGPWVCLCPTTTSMLLRKTAKSWFLLSSNILIIWYVVDAWYGWGGGPNLICVAVVVPHLILVPNVEYQRWATSKKWKAEQHQIRTKSRSKWQHIKLQGGTTLYVAHYALRWHGAGENVDGDDDLYDESSVGDDDDLNFIILEGSFLCGITPLESKSVSL